MYGLGCFQASASVLGLRASEFFCTPFKTKLSVFYSPLALLDISPASFQSQWLWRLFFPLQSPGLRNSVQGLEPWLLREGLQASDIPPTCGCSGVGMGGWGPGHAMFISLLAASVWLSLFIFNCGKSFLLISGHSQREFLYM